MIYFTDNTVLDYITNTGGFYYRNIEIDSNIAYEDYSNGERTYTCTTTQANGHFFIILDPTTEEVVDGNITETYFNKCLSNLSIVVETLDNAPATTITYPTATTTTDGLMSFTDKSKLDGITAGAAVTDVQINNTSILSSGIANIPIATTAIAGIMSAADKTKLDGITTMTGATSSTNGAAGLIPAPSSTDYEKFFRGDGTWQDGGRPMVILSYGSSTWSDFLEAYNHNVIVYARASSNSNPGTGVQGRMAFMAYLGLNSSGEPTNVEFQYYRSVSSHSATQMGDQVFIYKLDKTAGWSVTTREASIKQILVSEDSNMSVSWSSNKVTINGTALPAVTAADNGKILQVVDGVWTAVTPS